MTDVQDKNNADLNKTMESKESTAQSSSHNGIVPNSGIRYVLPILLILIALVMAIVRYPLMSNSAQISWVQYKLIMVLMAMAGFGWLMAMNRERRRELAGIACIILSLLLFSFFLTAGSDRTGFFPIGKYSIILAAFLFTTGMVLGMARAINPFAILGSLMLVAGLLHFLGMFGNAAGVPLPNSFFIRMILLYFGGWILYFLGKKPTAARFLLNLLIMFGVTFILFLMIISVIH